MSAFAQEIGGFPKKRTFQKLRHSSKPHAWSGTFWRKIDHALQAKMIRALDWYADRLPKHAKGRSYGEITDKVIRVFKALLRVVVRSRGGELDPSYEVIRRRAGCCRGTVAKALEILQRHGFLERMRRFVPARSGEPGKVEQDTNAYRLSLPPIAERLIASPGSGLDLRKVPKPRPPRLRKPKSLPSASESFLQTMAAAVDETEAWIAAGRPKLSSEYGD